MNRLIKTPEWFQVALSRYPDVPSVVRQQYSTISEAEAYGQSLGVYCVFEDRLDIAQLANEFLARLQDRGLRMPLSLMVHPAYFEAKYPNDLRRIPAMAESNVILLNSRADFWHDPLRKTRDAFAVHYWSTPSPLHLFFHEYAHLFQSEITRNRPLTPRQTTLALSICIRASKNVDEFLSEVYAGRIEGVEYDKDIMRMYHRLGGLKL